MLAFIETADDTIALRISDTITGADLDAVMDRLDAAMARHDKVHVFAETHAIDGFELAGLPAYMARATPLLGKLNRFGRMAIVADQTWVRVGARVESAILPFISYKVFTPDQRDEALAWVEGRAAT